MIPDADSRQLLQVIKQFMPDLYCEIEHRAAYPDEDDFETGDAYDNAVDLAELKALHSLIGEQLGIE